MTTLWRMSAQEFLNAHDEGAATIRQIQEWLAERTGTVPDEVQVKRLYSKVKAFKTASLRADAVLQESDGDLVRTARMARAAGDHDVAILINIAIEVEVGEGESVGTQDTSDDPNPSDLASILEGLPLLPDDKIFIHQQTQFIAYEKKKHILQWYARIFTHAQEREKNIIRRDNAGRYHANTFLRRYVQRILRSKPATSVTK